MIALSQITLVDYSSIYIHITKMYVKKWSVSIIEQTTTI